MNSSYGDWKRPIFGPAVAKASALERDEEMSVCTIPSSEEARYEQEAIAQDADLEGLMKFSSCTECSEVSLGPGPLAHAGIHFILLLPHNLDLCCSEPRNFLEARIKRSLMTGSAEAKLLEDFLDTLPSKAATLSHLRMGTKRNLSCFMLALLSTASSQACTFQRGNMSY